MGGPKEDLVFCKVSKYQKDVQVFIAESWVHLEKLYLTANATAIFVRLSKILYFSRNICQGEDWLEFSKAVCLENIKLL